CVLIQAQKCQPRRRPFLNHPIRNPLQPCPHFLSSHILTSINHQPEKWSKMPSKMSTFSPYSCYADYAVQIFLLAAAHRKKSCAAKAAAANDEVSQMTATLRGNAAIFTAIALCSRCLAAPEADRLTQV